MKGVAIYN